MLFMYEATVPWTEPCLCPPTTTSYPTSRGIEGGTENQIKGWYMGNCEAEGILARGEFYRNEFQREARRKQLQGSHQVLPAACMQLEGSHRTAQLQIHTTGWINIECLYPASTGCCKLQYVYVR